MERANIDGVSRLLKQIEIEGLNGTSLKSRPITRDFARENISKLRQMQAANRTSDKQRIPRKSNYKYVQSKVAAYINKDVVKPMESSKCKPPIESKTVSSASTRIKTPLMLPGSAMTNNCPGEIPKYLTERKLAWDKAKEELKIAQAASAPPGHVLLEEDERLAMLESLEADVAALYNELATLPLTVKTLKLRKRKEDIEGKIVEIEEAIGVFSKPKVFIRKKD